MKRLLWIVVMLVVVFARCAYADDIPLFNVNITYVTVSMGPNDGSGDNAFVTLIGPGTEISAIGGMACFEWCSGPIPDLNSVSLSQLFVDLPFQRAKIGGTTYNPDFVGYTCCFFSPSGDLNGSVSVLASDGALTQYNLMLPQGGGWNLTFDSFDGGYQFVHGEFTAGTPPAPVPEPGTLGLMATGFAGFVGVIRKKRLLCRSRRKQSSRLRSFSVCTRPG